MHMRKKWVAVAAAISIGVSGVASLEAGVGYAHAEPSSSSTDTGKQVYVTGQVPLRSGSIKTWLPGSRTVKTDSFQKAADELEEGRGDREHSIIFVGGEEKIGKDSISKIKKLSSEDSPVYFVVPKDSAAHESLVKAVDATSESKDSRWAKIASYSGDEADTGKQFLNEEDAEKYRLNGERLNGSKEAFKAVVKDATGTEIRTSDDRASEQEERLKKAEEALSKERKEVTGDSGSAPTTKTKDDDKGSDDSVSDDSGDSKDDEPEEKKGDKGSDDDEKGKKKASGDSESKGADADLAAVKKAVEPEVTKAESNGKVGVAFANPDGDIEDLGKAKEPVYSASTIKVPIAMAVVKNLKMDDTAEVKEAAGGAGGVITPGSHKVSELLKEMIENSDNTATNALIDKLGGFDKVNAITKEVGAPDFKLSNKMMSGETTSTITADSAVKTLQALWKSSQGDDGVVSKDGAKTIIDHMKAQRHRTKLPAKLGKDDVANKTGENTGISHDIGFLFNGDKTLVIAVTTTYTGSEAAVNASIGDIAKAAHDAMK